MFWISARPACRRRRRQVFEIVERRRCAPSEEGRDQCRRPHGRASAGGRRTQAGRLRNPAFRWAYFRGRSEQLPEPAFIDVVPIRFGIADTLRTITCRFARISLGLFDLSGIVMSSYPRDLIGYAQTAHAHWPGEALIAVQFVVNYEEGGGIASSTATRRVGAFLSEIVGAPGLAGPAPHEHGIDLRYGSRVGFWRLLRMFREREMPVTVFGVATALERNPQAVAAMKDAGWEIASHGLKWIEYGRFFARRRTRAHRRGRPYSHGGHGGTPARHVSGRGSELHTGSDDRGGRLPLQRGQLRRRIAVLA